MLGLTDTTWPLPSAPPELQAGIHVLGNMLAHSEHAGNTPAYREPTGLSELRSQVHVRAAVEGLALPPCRHPLCDDWY